MPVFSQYNSNAPDLTAEVAQAALNPLVIARQHTHFVEHQLGVMMADPEWATAPLDPLLETMAISADYGTDYDYAPDKMSFELYGTHELWPILLRLNYATHRGEFRGPELRFISPIYTGQLLIISRFGVERATRSDKTGIPDYGDLTVRKVYS